MVFESGHAHPLRILEIIEDHKGHRQEVDLEAPLDLDADTDVIRTNHYGTNITKD